ncbi:DUF6542 domain-containing protein [Skermania piniformis]
MPGVPAVGAVLVAVAFMLVGFLIDAATGSDLTRVFEVFFIGGCVVAACFVRYRALFTAMVQPPLLLFVAVPLAYQYFTEGGSTSLKNIALNVAIPLVNRFPMMLMATTAAVAVGALRIYLVHQRPDGTDGRSGSGRRVVDRRPRGRGPTERRDRPRGGGQTSGRRSRTKNGRQATSTYPGEQPTGRRDGKPERPPATDRLPTRAESRVARPGGGRGQRHVDPAARAAPRGPGAGWAPFPVDSPPQPVTTSPRPEQYFAGSTDYRSAALPVRNPAPGRHARADRALDPAENYATPMAEPRTAQARYSDY